MGARDAPEELGAQEEKEMSKPCLHCGKDDGKYLGLCSACDNKIIRRVKRYRFCICGRKMEDPDQGICDVCQEQQTTHNPTRDR